MRPMLLLLLLLLLPPQALGPQATGYPLKTWVIGGREAAPHSRPYMVSLQKAGTHLCGGVLVHPKWVLTAAHCLEHPMARLRLVLGLHTLADPNHRGLPFPISVAVPHPGYKAAPELKNDLAMLKLAGKVKSTKTIRPLALPSKRKALPAGARCSIAGWGLTRLGGPPAPALQELDVRVLDSRMCNNSRFWHGELSAHAVCFSADSPARAPCKGDSGGPLVCSPRSVAGILSFSSKTCTNVFRPPVATAVAPYLSWIRKVMRQADPSLQNGEGRDP